MVIKKCKRCGEEFESVNGARYCNREIKRVCPICKKEYITYCNYNFKYTCDDSYCKHRANTARTYTNRCSVCGNEFVTNNKQQKYCSDRCNPNVRNSLGMVKFCRECGKPFNPRYSNQIYCDDVHYRICKVCGKKFIVDVRSASPDRVTCSDECKKEYKKIQAKNMNPFIDDDRKQRFMKTMLERYGVTNAMHITGMGDRLWNSYKERTGYSCPMANPSVRRIASKKTCVGRSKLESHIAELLNQYNLEFIEHYTLRNDKISHEYDFYLPELKLLIDADGLYYHGYLDDPNGKQVLDYYDEDRLALTPPDHHLFIIPEGSEEQCIKSLYQYLQNNFSLDEYDSEIFKWCRSIEFPYPEYSDERIHKEWVKLCNYSSNKYIPQARIGCSIINKYHKSIWHAHVNNQLSPIDGWYDDEILKSIIRNRLIYINAIDPSKVLRGFSVAKRCQRVSVFNPILAKYLVNKYLSCYSEIFDPFSGFSGRLLGTCATGKRYIGQDLNAVAVSETNDIIKALGLDGKVEIKDILTDSSKHSAIFTCPPYGNKEIYGSETVFKSCDDWIDEIISRYDFQTGVFVVDSTSKYAQYVTEEIKSTSHFCTVKEKVIVINR